MAEFLADNAETIGYAAYVIAWLIGGAMAIAILGAMLAAMFGDWEVTYLHTGAPGRHGVVKRGRHRPEYVKTHTASAWQARSATPAMI